ncbi:hypothetical protein NXS15_00395 [Mycoplasma sp. CSL7475-4]|uniref:HinT-interacting membrane complex lipoprotein P60 n=1 Tax=Mycoplasma sp. CSL7475-4 TaxID=2973942 RepID=UPI00216B25A8|nr:hypothetical protein [Mycoplasma sp. CSL7475-4]MCS4536591.1 hypothetical protein [Mycoplasma sp. CSL7475-4]
MKKIKLLLASVSAITPFSVIACGQTIDTTAKLKQDDEIRKFSVEQLKTEFSHATLLSLYGIPFNSSSNLDETYINTFKDRSSKLFIDSYQAFQLYERNELQKDPFYFAQKVIDWNRDRILSVEDVQSIGDIEKDKPLTQDQFSIIWLNEKTQIRQEIEKMLFVNAYFKISDKDQLKKIDKNFKYTSELKYELENYLLSKYAVDKKFAQVWSKDNEASNNNDSFFTRGYNTISNVKTFNDFWNFSKLPKIKLKDDIEFVSGHESDKELYGYKGFKANTTSYSLKWDYDSLKNKTGSKDLYGYYDVNNDRLVNEEIEPNFVINPFKISNNPTNIPTVVYVNQVAPISSGVEVELPTVENDENNKTKVTLLSFKNTFYRDKLDILAFLFFLNDQSLYETAIKSFADIGYKFKVNDKSKALRETIKDLPFVELV